MGDKYGEKVEGFWLAGFGVAAWRELAVTSFTRWSKSLRIPFECATVGLLRVAVCLRRPRFRLGKCHFLVIDLIYIW